MRIFLLACAALALCVPAEAQTILNEEFWADLEPLAPGARIAAGTGEWIDFPGPRGVGTDTALERILEEARYVFSGMIFGFTFSYTPYDRSRNIAEEFSLRPAFQIPQGDPGLFVYQTRREGSRIYARLRYALHEFQEAWYAGTLSNIVGGYAGRGEAPIFGGYQEKITAVQNCVKNAVREYARSRIDNKPLRITGAVFLGGAPRIEISSGAFRAAGPVRLKIDDVVTYGVY
jgi:hypothetical protein